MEGDQGDSQWNEILQEPGRPRKQSTNATIEGLVYGTEESVQRVKDHAGNEEKTSRVKQQLTEAFSQFQPTIDGPGRVAMEAKGLLIPLIFEGARQGNGGS